MAAGPLSPATLQCSLGLGTKALASSSVEQKLLLSASALELHYGINICWDHLWCSECIDEREMGVTSPSREPHKAQGFIFHFI